MQLLVDSRADWVFSHSFATSLEEGKLNLLCLKIDLVSHHDFGRVFG